MGITMKRALAIAVKKWGKTAYVEDKGRRLGPSSPELREAAAEESKRLQAEKPMILEFKDYPDDMTLGMYRAEKKRIADAMAEWKKKHDPLIWKSRYQRYVVGTVSGVGGIQFAHVRGEGDTLEQALSAGGITEGEIHPNLVGVDG